MVAVRKVARGSSSITSDSITLIFPVLSVMTILSSAKAIAHGFSRLVARLCIVSFPDSCTFGGGIGGGPDGEVRITMDAIIAAIIPASLILLSTMKKLVKSY